MLLFFWCIRKYQLCTKVFSVAQGFLFSFPFCGPCLFGHAFSCPECSGWDVVCCSRKSSSPCSRPQDPPCWIGGSRDSTVTQAGRTVTSESDSDSGSGSGMWPVAVAVPVAVPCDSDSGSGGMRKRRHRHPTWGRA